MNQPMTNHRDRDRWSAPGERVIIIALLVFVFICSLASLTILGLHHDIDKAGLTAILGTITGAVGSAIVHKLSSRG